MSDNHTADLERRLQAEYEKRGQVMAENERLREALERIANLRSVTRYASIWNFDRRVRAIARAALREQP